MPLIAKCPSCQTQYRLKEEFAGRQVKCHKCGQRFQAPSAKAGTPSAPVKPQGTPATKRPTVPATAAAEKRSIPAKPAHTLPDDLLQEATTPARTPEPLPAEPVPTEPVPAAAAAVAPARPRLATKPCPHCDSPVPADVLYCPSCGLSIHKRGRDADRQREKEEKEAAREWIYALAAIGAAFVSAPLFFLLLALVLGGGLAMFICIIEVNLIVSIGSFAFACRVFRQEPPEPMDMLRIVGTGSIVGSAAAGWLLGPGILGLLAGTGIAIVISALLCMFQIGMPVVPSILVCISYNVFAAIFTVVGVLMLGILFASYMITTGEGLPRESPGRQESPFGPPGPPSSEPSDDDDHASTAPAGLWYGQLAQRPVGRVSEATEPGSLAICRLDSSRPFKERHAQRGIMSPACRSTCHHWIVRRSSAKEFGTRGPTPFPAA